MQGRVLWADPCRLIPVTAGHIYLDGEDISGLKGGALKQMRKKAQIIFQDPSACLNPRRTVRPDFDGTV